MYDKRRMPYNFWVIVLCLLIVGIVSGSGLYLSYGAKTYSVYETTNVNYEKFLRGIEFACDGGDCNLDNVTIRIDTQEAEEEDGWHYMCFGKGCDPEKISIEEGLQKYVTVSHSETTWGKIQRRVTFWEGVILVILGIVATSFYASNHWWFKGDKFHPNKKTKKKK